MNIGVTTNQPENLKTLECDTREAFNLHQTATYMGMEEKEKERQGLKGHKTKTNVENKKFTKKNTILKTPFINKRRAVDKIK